mgnify:CR=1 FL=1
MRNLPLRIVYSVSYDGVKVEAITHFITSNMK